MIDPVFMELLMERVQAKHKAQWESLTVVGQWRVTDALLDLYLSDEIKTDEDMDREFQKQMA